MKKYDWTNRIGFLVNEVGRLYGRRFDQLAREKIALSRAQCRLLGAVAMKEGGAPPTQVELANYLDLTPMGVATLCDRMEVAGWIARQPAPGDRRAKVIVLEPKARDVLDAAVVLSNGVQEAAFAGFDPAERKLLLGMLQRVRDNLQST